MDKPSIILERERDFTDLMNGMFAFIGQEWKLLLKTIAVYGGIPILLCAILTTSYTSSVFDNTFRNTFQLLDGTQDGSYGIAPGLWYYILAFLVSLATAVVQFLVTGLVFAYATVYRDKGHGNFVAKDVWRTFAGKLVTAVGLSVVITLMIVLGCMMCILPGIYLAIPLSFALMVLYAENSDFGQSIGRSFKLVQGNWWFTLGFLLVTGIIAGIVTLVFQIPGMIVNVIEGVLLTRSEGVELVGQLGNSPAFIVTSMVSSVGQSIMMSVASVAIAIQYFNLKEKQDKSSLFKKVSEISND